MSDEAPIETPEPTEPQAPTIDPQLALEIAAQQYGVTPEFLDGAIRTQEDNRRVSEELRRKQRELENDRIRIEALGQERQRYAQPEPEIDPTIRQAMQPLYEEIGDLKRMLVQERETSRVGAELSNHFDRIMATAPVHNRVDQERFFAAMMEIYPPVDGSLPAGITPERACYTTAKFLGVLPGSGSSMPQQGFNGNSSRDRRAPIYIPGSAAPSTSTPQPEDSETRRPGEPLEDYVNRLRAKAAKMGATHAASIPEGTKLVFE